MASRPATELQHHAPLTTCHQEALCATADMSLEGRCRHAHLRGGTGGLRGRRGSRICTVVARGRRAVRLDLAKIAAAAAGHAAAAGRAPVRCVPRPRAWGRERGGRRRLNGFGRRGGEAGDGGRGIAAGRRALRHRVPHRVAAHRPRHAGRRARRRSATGDWSLTVLCTCHASPIRHRPGVPRNCCRMHKDAQLLVIAGCIGTLT